jgi:hypothetical protein
VTLLFMDGFDAKDLASKWIVTSFGGGSPSFTSSTRFGTGFAAQCATAASGGNYRILYAFTAASQIFAGAAIQRNLGSGLSYSSAILAMYGDTATTPHLYLVVTSLGAVQVYRGNPLAYTSSAPGGTLIATSANGLVDAGWHYIEFGATIDSSTGTAVVHVDNTQVINFTGNTKNGGTNTTIDAVSFSNMTFGGATYGSPIIDDLYVCNSSGGGSTSTFLGDVRVETCLPNGAGSSTQFTPTGSGTNYLNANDVPDSTTTFNSDSTAGHRDTYALANLAAGTGTVFAVQQVMVAFKTGAGSASLKGAQQSGATVSYGATRSLGTSSTVYTDVSETNPATSATWTAGDVNGLEAGAEVV